MYFHSASVGRSATFCALKIVVEQVKTEGIIDVFYTVHTMRTRQPLAVRQIVSVHTLQTVKFFFALVYASRVNCLCYTLLCLFYRASTISFTMQSLSSWTHLIITQTSMTTKLIK